MPTSHGDISFKEFASNLNSAFKFLLSKWLTIFIISFLFAVIGVVLAYLKKPGYTGTVSFVLSSDTKSSNIAGLASQFGFDLGGGSGGNDVFTGDNILTLFRSQKMLKRALFKKVPETNESLINLMGIELKWAEKWKEKERLQNAFPFPDDYEKMTPVQDSIFREIHKVITEGSLSVSRLDKKLSVFILNTKSSNEKVACYLSNFLLDETASFYITTKTSIARKNLEMLQSEADSLQSLLGGTITSTASTIDKTYNLNPALLIKRSAVQKGQVNIAVLTSAYGEVIKNLEFAKLILQKETPVYQVIDYPRLPLRKEKASKLMYLIFSGGIGFILTCIILLIKRALK